MTIPTIQFEAKKHAWRQTQDGVVVSFVVHPNELHAGFAVAPLGTRYQVVVVQIDDNDEPVSPGSVRAAHGVAAEGNPPLPSTVPGESKRERTLPEKVGMRCADPAFQVWIERQTGRADIGEMEAAAWVRKECVVESRKAILPGTEAAALWLALETRFLEDTRQMAERRR